MGQRASTGPGSSPHTTDRGRSVSARRHRTPGPAPVVPERREGLPGLCDPPAGVERTHPLHDHWDAPALTPGTSERPPPAGLPSGDPGALAGCGLTGRRPARGSRDRSTRECGPGRNCRPMVRGAVRLGAPYTRSMGRSPKVPAGRMERHSAVDRRGTRGAPQRLSSAPAGLATSPPRASPNTNRGRPMSRAGWSVAGC